ncbi:hypothetical protein BGW38_008139, partial [Lunasporangiospora selenospora]
MITPSIQTDLPTQYPLSRKDRQTIGRTSIPLVDPKQPRRNGKNVNGIRGGLFYRLILRPNSIFMRLAATQQGARQKIVKVVKTCADKAMRTDIKTLMYWVMALIMLRGEVWHLIAATAVKSRLSTVSSTRNGLGTSQMGTINTADHAIASLAVRDSDKVTMEFRR